MAANNYVASVPKLLGRENYDEWAFAAESFLIIDNLKDCLDGVETDATKVSKARAKLILTLDSSLYVHVKDCQTAKDLWDRLKMLFDDRGFTRRISLLRHLISLRLENCNSMGHYVTQMVEAAQKMKGTGFSIDDEWVGSLLLAGLPEKFAPMIMAIEHSGISITTDAIKTKLLDMESETGKTGSALVVKHFSKIGNNAKNHTSVSHPHQSNVKNKSDVQCYGCKQFGHYKNKCPNRNSGKQNSKDNRPGVSGVFSAVFLSGQFSRKDWYIDSGASAHITVLESCLDDCKPSGIEHIVVANNTKVPIKCAGNVKIQTQVGRESYDILVKDVLCIPELTTNLISVSQLVKNGNKVHFESDVCKIFNTQNTLIATADLVDNVYRLNLNRLSACFLTTADTWHRRLGHLNFTDLKKMFDGAVLGMNSTQKIKNNNCVV